MKLSDFVVREAIITDLRATTKEGAIPEIVRSLRHAGCFSEADQEGVARAILDREALGTTGIGRGVACPEARHPRSIASSAPSPCRGPGWTSTRWTASR